MNKAIRVLSVTLLLLAGTGRLSAQTTAIPFDVRLEPLSIPNLGGIQSYAFGQADGKWLIVGGRLDGLHRRQPWASFDAAGNNNRLIVIDPSLQQSWNAPLGSLPPALQEQMSSTNMEFHQEGDYLYCIGGYGYSPTVGDHLTFDKLTAINVPDLVAAVINGNSIAPHFRQIADPAFQVTGGKLRKLYGSYYLMGGQKFMGRYNPMGPDHGPGFVQEYTNAIRVFELADDGSDLSVTHHPAMTDSLNLHRRDYNAEPQILPDGSEGITMFSGVFQHSEDLPFLNPVTIDSSGYELNNDFQQLYNHYHCPVLPLYSGSQNMMYNIFFGGIAQFYEEGGLLVQDDNVPFVKTVAAVTRDASGSMSETKLPLEMPDFLGAGAEFIPNRSNPQFGNGVSDLDALPADTVLIGYIFGGINSTEPNIFFINEGSESTASSQIFKVFLTKNPVLGMDGASHGQQNGLNLTIYPNPSSGMLNIAFELPENGDATIGLYSPNGGILLEQEHKGLPAGKHTILVEVDGLRPYHTYLVLVKSGKLLSLQKLIME